MKSTQPLISVIIPVFNRSWQLRRALESLQGQTFKDFEVIVCDDGSTEDISSLVNDFEAHLNIHLIRMPNWGGPAKPRNEGLKLASGQWISYLDSDDWWDVDRLDVVAKRLNEDVDILYHPLRVVKESSTKKPREKRAVIGDPIFGDPFKQMMLFGNPLPTSATIVRANLLVAHHGMSEDRGLIAIEDFDCWLRLASVGAHFYFLDQCLGNYWVGSDAISGKMERHIEAQLLLYQRHESKVAAFDSAQALARQNYILGTMNFRLGNSSEALKCLLAAKSLPTLKLVIKRWVLMIYSALNIVRDKVS